MKDTKRKGCITELKVITKLIEYGEVSIPYGNNARYDCILDHNGKLLKIQIKTAKRVDNNRFIIPFQNSITTKNISKKKRYTPEEIDYIATVIEDKVYLFPLIKSMTCMTISFKYPNNGMKSTIHLAEQYEINNILE